MYQPIHNAEARAKLASLRQALRKRNEVELAWKQRERRTTSHQAAKKVHGVPSGQQEQQQTPVTFQEGLAQRIGE
jgi:hypothetical protein